MCSVTDFLVLSNFLARTLWLRYLPKKTKLKMNRELSTLSYQYLCNK